MPGKTSQFQVITDVATRRKLDALRIVMGTSRADVINEMIKIAWRSLSQTHRAELERLYALGRMEEMADQAWALGIGRGWEAIVDMYAERNGRKKYGETLAELEAAAGITLPENVPV
jgi:hypothetical protein